MRIVNTNFCNTKMFVVDIFYQVYVTVIKFWFNTLICSYRASKNILLFFFADVNFHASWFLLKILQCWLKWVSNKIQLASCLIFLRFRARGIKQVHNYTFCFNLALVLFFWYNLTCGLAAYQDIESFFLFWLVTHENIKTFDKIPLFSF